MFLLNPDLIFIPFTIMAFVSLWLYVVVSKVRIDLYKTGKVKAGAFAIYKDEPDESIKVKNVLSNQFESPVLFYAVCLALYVTQSVNIISIALAFLYVALKILHIKIHITHNHVVKRYKMFLSSFIVLALMWLSFAFQLLMKQF